jgi:hypothetical protein
MIEVSDEWVIEWYNHIRTIWLRGDRRFYYQKTAYRDYDNFFEVSDCGTYNTMLGLAGVSPAFPAMPKP